MNPTPKQLGFRMPAEWEPHKGTWLSWPKDPVTFPDRVEKVENLYCEMMSHLSAGEKVFLLVDDAATKKKVLQKLGEIKTNLPNIVIHIVPTADVWIRDYGPNFLLRGKELAFNHWIFNAWGGKYEELMADTAIPEKLQPLLKCKMFEPGIVLEGGSIDVNGEGVCLTTKQCLLNKNRNPHLSQKEIENYLKEYLGLNEIVWLNEGVEGDDTDGHIDDIARFVAPNTVVCAVEEDLKDKNYKILQENYEILKSRFETIPLPMPGIVSGDNGKLPASYANFLIANECVLAPIFNHKNDGKALDILRECFPKRRIVGLDCRDLIWGMGAIHCITQQQPAI
ncbi:MAG: agmatine deiminase family protein [Deltaproteobacteria bacterium]|nr:agmatine deiminase family protein [Deltaproteobacteria bacterium]